MKKYFLIVVSVVSVLLFSCKDNKEPTPSAKNDNPSLTACKTVSAMPKSAKRGLCYKETSLADAFLLTQFISWYYNWGNSHAGDDANLWFDNEGVDFCPMCWNGNYNKETIRRWCKNHPNTKYLLGFNEPNLTDQANMTPTQAAELWPDVVALAKELNLKLGAPAMNYGTLAGYNDPIKWLDEFFAKPGCSIDDIDFIPIHCYMLSPIAVASYVERFRKYNKPVWMTEFCGWESISSVETQKKYASEVLNYMEKEPLIERYAWFMARMSGSLNSKPYNQLLTKGSPVQLTELGQIYAGVSSQDKSVCIDGRNRIPAHWYADYTSSVAPIVTNSTDTVAGENNTLMIYNFQNRDAVYQVDAVNATTTIQFRYAAVIESILIVYVDDNPVQIVNLPKGASMTDWQTYLINDVKLSGKHIIRFQVTSGAINFSWFKLA